MYSHASVKSICHLLGYTSQAYHKHQSKQLKQGIHQQMILEQIDHIRTHQPRCGGRKLFIMLQPFFTQHNITIGRDKFFDLLKQNKLLVRGTKRSVHTTNSKHHFYRYPNLVKDFTPLKAHEPWVADITYIPLKERFAYLFLITDAYSRKIVGFHVSDDMKVSSALLALKKASAQKPLETIVIHHSDRGIQYCSSEYVNLLQQHHALTSMTNNGDPLENAIAERANGILKTELISSFYSDIEAASIHISRCITIYNYRRRHSSLNWQIPAVVHEQKGPQIRRWKNYYQPPKTKEMHMAATSAARQKNSCYSFGSNRSYFSPRTVYPRLTPGQVAKKSTLFRMNYLGQPIIESITKTSQLFSGRVNKKFSFSSGVTNNIRLHYLTSRANKTGLQFRADNHKFRHSSKPCSLPAIFPPVQ